MTFDFKQNCPRLLVCYDHFVKSKCNKNAKICEFHFNIGYKETMVYYDSDNMRAHPVFTINNRLYRRTSCNDYLPITKEGNMALLSFKTLPSRSSQTYLDLLELILTTEKKLYSTKSSICPLPKQESECDKVNDLSTLEKKRSCNRHLS
ncbi:hypothetical protein KUTeg_024609 [Tegillarca granosa]|uniref:THAP-type domain-containing protein n=1 Tax=Tegillarca granosa TaxID=220873 RepID=A0ABQ9E442_TEGGR|nr:hypothetical protein KUTeg_024609 [Tegillarca granosa]